MNFDFIAPYYDRLAHWVFGEQLAKSRRALLDEIPQVLRVLMLGAGSGDMLFSFAERSIGAQIEYVEPSAKFVKIAREAWEHHYPVNAHQVNWVASPWQKYEPKYTFDLITTDYLLDLFPEEKIERLITKIASLLKIDGLWLYIDFCQNEKTAWWWRPLRFLMYRFFALVAGVPGRKITNIRAIAERQGFEIMAEKTMAKSGIEAILFRLAPKSP
ncbi:MAG: methyltransferase [Bacteroidota bacterium]